MSRTLALTASLVLLIAGLPVFGQEAGGTRIALVSIQDTITRTQEGQKRTQELREKYQPAQQQIEAKQNEVGQLQNQLTQGAAIMSDDQKRKLQRDIQSGQRDAQRMMEDAEAEYQRDVQAFQQDVYGRVRTVIHDYMLEKGYSLILDISSQQTPVVDAKTELLITNEIIELYDKKHPVAAATSSAAPAAPSATANP
jgi:outer membrane protein